MSVSQRTSPETALDLLEKLRSGAISAQEAVLSALARCEAGHASNAMISLRTQPALAEAVAADQDRTAGKPLGRLHGLPIVVKDNIAVGGWALTGGSPAFSGHIAPTDASVVARLRAEGAIVIGKSSLHELAFGVTNKNAHFGPARNPHDPSRITGGSSGGSAAAVAAGFVTVAISSDTGGSGRIPAALCGCAGFRPTKGRYAGDGMMLLSETRDTITTMAHTMADIVLLDQVMAGEWYPVTAPQRPLSLGLLSPFADTDLEPGVRAAFEAGLGRLARHGVEIIPVNGAELQKLDEDIGLAVVLFEASCFWHDFVPTTLGITFDAFVERIGSPDVRRIFAGFGRTEHDIPEAVYNDAMQVTLPRLRAAYAGLFSASGVDAFVFPTVPVTAPPIGQDEMLHLCGLNVPIFPTMIRNVGPGSLAGIPGVSLPLPVSEGQLPVGLALDAPADGDVALLRLAVDIQRMLAS